ncbi:MAG TPA: DinB family protein [Terriglobales bacterium]|jgi:hypothetical protein|nr:DinB family protein [Terriglobales bacterium]
MSAVSLQPGHDQLAALKREFEDCSAAAKDLLDSVNATEFAKRPQSGGWSIAECIAHLTATTQLYLPILSSALQNAPAGNAPYKMDWRGRLLKWVLEPPYRTRVKTLPSLEPGVHDSAQVLPAFLVSQKDLADALERWRGLALGQVLITSPFNKRLRYNIYSLFNVVAAHQRHHIWQAQRVRDQIKGK